MTRSKRAELDKKIELATIEPFNVIFEGESGVGKEYFAKLIHKRRSWTKDFIVFDWECSHSNQLKILDHLVKNHLEVITDFVNHQRHTYFFRRIDLLAFQIKLFEIFEEKVKRGAISKNQLHRLGLISSWEKKKNDRSQQNNFSYNPLRELFPLRITILPLRERRKEMHSLLYTILHSVNQEQNRKVFGFSEESIEIFLRYSWPNNLDELESEIQRAVALTKDYDVIKPQALSKKLAQNHVLSRTT